MEDVDHIIDTMPRLTDTKEAIISYIPLTKQEIQSGCRDLIEQLLTMLDNTMIRFGLYKYRVTDAFTDEDICGAIACIELMNRMYDMFYPDGNYGVNWRYVIYNYGHLGDFYHRSGNDQKALENLRRCAVLARRFDDLPNETARHGLFFEGTTLNKQQQVNVYLDTSVCKQMTHHMTHSYPLSDAFKATEAFQEILQIMQP